MLIPLTYINSKLSGMPSSSLSLLLLGIAVYAALVAYYGSPVLKLASAVWLVAP